MLRETGNLLINAQMERDQINDGGAVSMVSWSDERRPSFQTVNGWYGAYKSTATNVIIQNVIDASGTKWTEVTVGSAGVSWPGAGRKTLMCEVGAASPNLLRSPPLTRTDTSRLVT